MIAELPVSMLGLCLLCVVLGPVLTQDIRKVKNCRNWLELPLLGISQFTLYKRKTKYMLKKQQQLKCPGLISLSKDMKEIKSVQVLFVLCNH